MRKKIKSKQFFNKICFVHLSKQLCFGALALELLKLTVWQIKYLYEKFTSFLSLSLSFYPFFSFFLSFHSFFLFFFVGNVHATFQRELHKLRKEHFLNQFRRITEYKEKSYLTINFIQNWRPNKLFKIFNYLFCNVETVVTFKNLFSQ